MLFFVIGFPGRFTDWCSAATARLALHTFGTVDVISADTLEDLSKVLIVARQVRAVVCSNNPSGTLLERIAKSEKRLIVTTADPRSALIDLLSQEACSFPAALRRVASSCAAVSNALSTIGGRPLHHGPPQSVMREICQSLGLSVSEAQLALLLENSGTLAPIDDEFETAKRWQSLDPINKKIAEDALGLYIESDTQTPLLHSIVWDPILFHSPDNAEQIIEGSIDITGRARCLFAGPEIHIPPGHWRLYLTLEFSLEAAEYEFVIEITGCEPHQQYVIRADDRRRLDGNTDIVVSATAARPISLRLSSRRSAFDGQVTLISMRVERLPEGRQLPDGSGR